MLPMGRRDLRFVQRGSILLQRGIELRLGSPPPSLGVSSLDLGRRLARGPFLFGGSGGLGAIPPRRDRAAALRPGSQPGGPPESPDRRQGGQTPPSVRSGARSCRARG